MNKHKLLLLSAVLLLASLTTGCWLWPFGGGGAPQTGFKVTGGMYVPVVGGGLFFVGPTSVRGTWQFDNGSAVGNTLSFSACCGTISVPDGRVPARWLIFAGAPGCGQITNPLMDISAGQTKSAQCLTFGILFPFAIAPGTINLQAPPATMTITGSDLNTTYGLPRIEYMDQYTGNLIAVTTATSVAGDGSSLQAATPDLSSVYSGTFSVFVANAKADGSFEYVGATTVDLYGRDYVFDPPPPPPPGECGCPPDVVCLPCDLLLN